MFTGIIESVGAVSQIVKFDNYLKLAIVHNFSEPELKPGDSIACDGACLTVVAFDKNTFAVDVSQETLNKTIAGSYQIGSKVNLERAVKAGDRLAGHFVTGHIDDVGEIKNIERIGQSLMLQIKFKPSFDKLVVTKGSIAINGVSLTLNEIENGSGRVNLIPHTLANTNLASLKVNQFVNLEFDLIGKYAAKSTTSQKTSTLTFAKLAESGW
jgi:riboflavin synthase